MTTLTLPDQQARDRARRAFDETVFVTAGAGAGKTRVLVDRICGLVTQGPDPVPMRSVAAVTFTEKAAAEMRDRVRAELTRLSGGGDPAVSARARTALDELDLAAIGTLHSFAARLLMENPIEAGLPPVIRAMDEVSSDVRSERWWTEIRTRLLEHPSTALAMQVLLAAGASLDAVREVTRRMQADWDLVADRCSRTAPATTLALDLSPLRRAVADLLHRRDSECTDHSDLLYERLPLLVAWLEEIDRAIDDLERIPLLVQRPKLGGAGSAKKWVDVASVKADVRALFALAEDMRDALVAEAVAVVVAALGGAVLDEADTRRRQGELQFQDLLVQARDMLRRSAAARVAASGRYRRLLLDEFQDTDPLQIEIAVRILAGEDGWHDDWQDCPIPAGSLFVVGDPKQSIYRFRRADITTFLSAQQAISDGRPAVLSTNFRSHPDLLAWVNTVFGDLIEKEDGGQPEYEALQPDPARAAFHAADGGHRVSVIGAEPIGGDLNAEGLRQVEAAQVAAAIAQMLHERPVVEHRVDDGWASRALEPADICVLVPARTALAPLERELDRLNVPYRTEASSMVYRSDEVRDLLLTARAVDDPTDALALVEALRTPLFGCGDDDLVTWKAAGGRFSVFADLPADVDASHPVAEALQFFAALARTRSLMSPSEVLGHIIDERRAMETPSDSPQYRETWRRLRFVVDQARAWSEAEHGSLRDFLDWAMRQAVQEERANEIVLPERDVEAIRILTIHAAKGLEFPVVVLSGMASRLNASPGALVWPADGPPEVSFLSGARSVGWKDAYDDERRMLFLETVRLLYVATTRAESRLVVSLVRAAKPKGLSSEQYGWTRAELLAQSCDGAGHDVLDLDPAEVPALPGAPTGVAAPITWDEWVALRGRAHRAASEREADSATDIAKGRVPLPAGLEIPRGC